MTRTDAFEALVSEVLGLDVRLALDREVEESARQQSVAARKYLDDKRADREAAEARRDATRDALDIIAKRDGVAPDVVAALIAGGRS